MCGLCGMLSARLSVSSITLRVSRSPRCSVSCFCSVIGAITAKKPDTCIFCRGTGLTNEHVIPDWVKQLIPRRKRAGNLFTLTDHAAHRRSRKVRQGSPTTRKVRFVCGTCNHGWLSGLEDELKSTLTELILGDPVTLTNWKQRRLDTWAVKPR